MDNVQNCYSHINTQQLYILDFCINSKFQQEAHLLFNPTE
jgi:hypothetical protein